MNYIMENENIVRRLLGSLIDKLFIIVLFVIAYLSYYSLYSTGALGVYLAMFGMSPSSYEYIVDTANRWGGALNIDIRITGLFVIVNILYYIFSEAAMGISLGKYICGLTLKSETGEDVSFGRKIMRSYWLLLLMIVVIAVRYFADFNYYIAIVLFFIVLDISVFFNGRSLIDLLSRTYNVKRQIY